MRASVALVLLGIAPFMTGCTEADPGPGDEAAATTAAQAEPVGAAADHDAAAAGHDPAAGDHGAAAEHAAAGEARPLLQIMQQLGSDMAALTHGLMTEDRALLTNSAAAMAQHSPIADVERIRAELGADMPEFERLDGSVHTALVQLHDAAAAGRTDEVLTRLNEAQRGCVACHAAFRERLRTNPAR